MSIPVPPATYIRAKSFELDDEATFTSPQLLSYTATTGKWSMGPLTVHESQLDNLATAIEKLFLQDFANNSLDLESMNVNAAMAADSVTVLQAAFTVTVNQSGNAPSGFVLGPMAASVGLAWSLRTWIRENMGIGTPYVP